MKRLNTAELVLILLTGILGISFLLVNNTSAEQSGGSPESGELSVLKTVYLNLQGLGYGSEEGSYGPMWNRIISSANWVPNGTVTPDKVALGYTFYNGDRISKVGTYNPTNYDAQSLQVLDFRDVNGSSSWAEWEKTNDNPEVWKDKRTGLYWSPIIGSADNQFTTSTCSFFITVPRGSYSGNESNCGNAINLCATLELDSNSDEILEKDWYLPTQAQLMQVYLDGIFLSTDTSWISGSAFWSSTQDQASSGYAWSTYLYLGLTNYNSKSSSLSVRCVRKG